MSDADVPQAGGGIAIVGMAGRFPGANTIAELWQNLCAGIESITRFSEEQLIAAGNDPAVVRQPNYVNARGALGDSADFDAAFFGHSPGVAELMDPQHRLFLECAWAALEDAGYDSERTRARIGVFAGESMNTYLLSNLYQHLKMVASVESLQAAIGNDKDSLTSEVAYKLNLRGPSITVQTASSTSLSAVHLACQSLLNYECDLALAGGVSIHFPETAGYLYQQGGATSQDGHCRAFDAEASGFVNGHGAGVVVLKRLEDALDERDTIVAVIRGSAINNDGSSKVSYMAPSADAQAQVVARAQAIAGVSPETITYIEAHGTGTHYGDPIEIAGLTKAFRRKTQARQFCAIGSVKPNIGHLDTAAGVTGLIKAALALRQRQIPPSINCTTPNPQIDWANSPFYVNTSLSDWPAGPTPRRAGVSSFGMGGTNVHVVLEEAPPQPPSDPAQPWQLLTVSAKTSTALERATERLAAHLRQHPAQNLADIAYTLQVGRRPFAYRRVLLCRDHADGAAALETIDPERVLSSVQEPGSRQLIFMFAGQGAQYVGMARGLYTSAAVFRAQLDRCCELLRPQLGFDLLSAIYPQHDDEAAAQRLSQTLVTQPALFAIEYALAQQLIAWGLEPSMCIGHSIGEYVAATLAGVFALEDALRLVAARGRLIQGLPGGNMLAVALAEAEVAPLLQTAELTELAIAAINGPALTVVAGPSAAIGVLEAQLSERGVNVRRLHTSHAFHSPMLEPILEPFLDQLRRIQLQPPQIPFVSNVTGTWITAAEATDPRYWVRHLRAPVRFAAGLELLLQQSAPILLEVGPGQTLSQLARQHPARSAQQPVLTSLRHPREQRDDLAFLLEALGKLWLSGLEVDWERLHRDERRQRVQLPTYPFERQRYWIEPTAQPSGASAALGLPATLDRQPDPADWFYVPSWKRTAPTQWRADTAPQRWLVLGETLADELVERLQARGQRALAVQAGPSFARLADGSYRMHPGRAEDYAALLADLRARDAWPERIIHAWSASPPAMSNDDALDRALSAGLGSLILLTQALIAADDAAPLHLAIVSLAAHDVTGSEQLQPEQALVLGACRVIPQEHPQLSCQTIDLELDDAPQRAALLDRLLADVQTPSADMLVAYRGPHRWVEAFEAAPLAAPDQYGRLREGGVYVITGGLGGVGLEIAAYLAAQTRARLVLIGRSALPARDGWEAWLTSHADDDATSRKLRRLQAIEATGAELLPISADVTDLTAMRAALAQAVERWGRVDGLIHAAGLAGGGLIQLKTLDAAARVLAPKVRGALVLDTLARELRPDWVLLCSSLTALTGELGQIDYCAANAFLDALAHRSARSGPPTIAVNWEAWHNLGMAADGALPAEIRELRDQLFRAPLQPTEGVDALGRILAHAQTPQVIVSTQPLAARLAHARTLTSQLRQTVERSVRPASTAHPRPDLPTPYVPPRNETERIVSQLWQDILRIERVGVHDNFFDLGGNSLTGIEVINRLTSLFDRKLPAVSLYEGPTVSALARLLTPDETKAPAYEGSQSRGKLRREARRLRAAAPESATE